jgi:hypothetical protein
MFASLVIATLTLGIGASTGMFSVVNGVLLKPLPYGDPARLVWMYGSFRGGNSAAVSPPDFVAYRNRNEVFERLAIAFGATPATYSRKMRSTIAASVGSIPRSPVVTIPPVSDFTTRRRNRVRRRTCHLRRAREALDASSQLGPSGRARSLFPWTNVQVRNVAFRERDDLDAGEGETLEEACGVFLGRGWSGQAIRISASTTSKRRFNASRISAWKPARRRVAPEIAWSVNS